MGAENAANSPRRHTVDPDDAGSAAGKTLALYPVICLAVDADGQDQRQLPDHQRIGDQ